MKTDHELEEALRGVMVAHVDESATVDRVLARLGSLPLQKRAFTWWPVALMDWNFSPAWPRLAALAGAAVLGISVGLSNLGTRIAADLNLVRVASADDTSANAFETDAGLRP